MRTTLTLDDDVADALKERARHLDQPFKQIVNDVLRCGLRPETAHPAEPYSVRTHSTGFAPGVDPLRLNQLVDELEVEAYLEKEARIARAASESARDQ
ncbi:MAG: antitoxin [Acidimicrobiales bacterium]|nr:hypothetical protein [Acidimicrobiaceae bacterium]MXV88066.1 antitoxin [Acidimicrobiales bacterium]MXX42191.1 antitoxin [Acidimicrobiales bacterium]MXZ14446.1 antitoxin [Acidimicrobiales bacterium]MYB82704.1 antitoxin [Acidimicrobiales bacterium]